MSGSNKELPTWRGRPTCAADGCPTILTLLSGDTWCRRHTPRDITMERAANGQLDTAELVALRRTADLKI
jgi:hypothetical protein